MLGMREDVLYHALNVSALISDCSNSRFSVFLILDKDLSMCFH